MTSYTKNTKFVKKNICKYVKILVIMYDVKNVRDWGFIIVLGLHKNVFV